MKANLSNVLTSITDMQGKLREAWVNEQVAEEDIPESAKKPVGEDVEEEPAGKKKAAPKKKKVGRMSGLG